MRTNQEPTENTETTDTPDKYEKKVPIATIATTVAILLNLVPLYYLSNIPDMPFVTTVLTCITIDVTLLFILTAFIHDTHYHPSIPSVYVDELSDGTVRAVFSTDGVKHGVSSLEDVKGLGKNTKTRSKMQISPRTMGDNA